MDLTEINHLQQSLCAGQKLKSVVISNLKILNLQILPQHSYDYYPYVLRSFPPIFKILSSHLLFFTIL